MWQLVVRVTTIIQNEFAISIIDPREVISAKYEADKYAYQTKYCYNKCDDDLFLKL